MDKGCGMIIAREGIEYVYCGERLFGKIRYCVRCSQNLKTAEDKDG